MRVVIVARGVHLAELVIRQHQALGTPVSAATLTRIRATLRAALNAAIRRGLIPLCQTRLRHRSERNL